MAHREVDPVTTEATGGAGDRLRGRVTRWHTAAGVFGGLLFLPGAFLYVRHFSLESLCRSNAATHDFWRCSLWTTKTDVGLGLAVMGLAVVGFSAFAKWQLSRLDDTDQRSLVPGWSGTWVSVLGLGSAALVAAIDAASSSRVLLLGLVALAPCGVSLTGRWRPTALAAIGSVGLVIVLGLPDQIWGTRQHAAFVAAVSVVAMVAVGAGLASERSRSTHS